MSGSRFGTIIDHGTGLPAEPATAEEWRYSALLRSNAAVEPGNPEGAWVDEDAGYVRVDGGPRAEVSAADIGACRDAADAAGNARTASLCRTALGKAPGAASADREFARVECVRIILGDRVSTATSSQADDHEC